MEPHHSLGLHSGVERAAERAFLDQWGLTEAIVDWGKTVHNYCLQNQEEELIGSYQNGDLKHYLTCSIVR